MKNLILSILIFFSGCSANKEVINLIKNNANSYTKLQNSSYINAKDATIYFTKKNTILFVTIYPKDINKKIKIISCKIDNKTTFPIENNLQNYKAWQTQYILEIPKNRFKLVCTLNNNTIFSKNF